MRIGSPYFEPITMTIMVLGSAWYIPAIQLEIGFYVVVMRT
jgi:hypothetical protein